jgi:hypothetical protein
MSCNFFLGHNDYKISNTIPIGMGIHSIEDENLILDIKRKLFFQKQITSNSIGLNLISEFLGENLINPTDDKIFCIWQNSDDILAKDDSILKKEIKKFVLQNPNFFDLYESDKFTLEQYLNTLSKYKYSLCVNPYGIDPNPIAWHSLILNITPIIIESENSRNIFSEIKDSVLFIKNEKDLLEIYINRPVLKPAPMHFLSQEYWKDKIA